MDLDQLFEKFETLTQRDLKLNFKKFYGESSLQPKEAALLTVACAESVACLPLSRWASEQAAAAGATAEELTEAKDVAAIMGLMNMYYRFRHHVEDEAYRKPAGLRMNVMARPVNGKPFFEMMALAVSILNGCSTCMQSHEKSLSELETPKDKIHDLARLSSIIKGLEVSFRQIQAAN